MVETRNTAVIAMAHLTASTITAIMNAAPQSLPYMAASLGPHMIMAYAHTENGGDPPIPADLWACLKWARAQRLPPTPSSPGVGEFGGYDYVLFDADAESVEGLPLYDGDVPSYPVGLPPAPWKRRPGEFWACEYEGEDIGGQLMAIVEDARGDPLAWVLADEDDGEASAALRLILDAPEIAKRYAALVKVMLGLATAAENRAATMDDDAHEGADARPPTGDDYNDLLDDVQATVAAAERIIAGL